jgi:hypothetical protein
MSDELTKAEKKVLSLLRQLERAIPQGYWIYANEDGIALMRNNSDGKQAMTEFGGVDQDYIVDSVDFNMSRSNYGCGAW